MTSVEKRFLTGFRSEDADTPGLVQEDDGTVWLIAPDGTRTQISGGGSMPFPIEAGDGVPGFDFADTFDVGTLYYDQSDAGNFAGLYLKTTNLYDVSAAVQAGGTDPATLPNLGITQWTRFGGDNNGWPVPGVSVNGNGSIEIDAKPGKATVLSDLMAFSSGSGNGLWWNWIGSAIDGEQNLVAVVGSSGAHSVKLANPDGSLGPAPGGVIFPSADPHVAGAWWDNAGTLTRSSG